MSDQIFVYGTLMEGYRNFDKYLQGHVLKIEKATVKGKLYDMPYLDFPALLEGNDTVHGEVITVDNFSKLQKDIDAMEGYKGNDDDMYKRIPKTVFLESGEEIILDVYQYHAYSFDPQFKTEACYIPEGSWRAFNKKLGRD
ncbi:gamma-glutamylcyclotransferase family protein [Erysipelothrix urinaevulpis]|uniref:gamma-glutamylcyclotransferase family protein n=1 Tax=Erysipelothrix urinaevulpis TaxID=2683717 RepID=UPI0013586721|nr:gamma-glutamylcyclotransferase family protein [Erysipelothrix urinaevulpis]